MSNNDCRNGANDHVYMYIYRYIFDVQFYLEIIYYDLGEIYCNAYAPLPYMSRITFIAIFCVSGDHSIVRALVYDARSPQSNPHVDIEFFGYEICSTVIIC